MSGDSVDDDHYPYADAVACALAAVLLLFVAAVVNQGLGEQAVPAYGTLALTLKYKESPKGRPLASIELDGKILVTADNDRVVHPGPTFEETNTPLRIGESAEVRLETPEEAFPAVSLQMARFIEGQTDWTIQVNVRDSRPFGTITLRLWFDAGQDSPVELSALYWDNQGSESHPALTGKFNGFGPGPTTVEIIAGGDSVEVRKGVDP